MSYSSGEAAEQVVRMTLNGVEVAAKISGKAAERLAVLLYAVLQDQKKTRGKTRLTSMLKSGKELKVFSVSDGELERFCREAKKYGVLYCVLKDKTDRTINYRCNKKVDHKWVNSFDGIAEICCFRRALFPL